DHGDEEGESGRARRGRRDRSRSGRRCVALAPRDRIEPPERCLGVGRRVGSGLRFRLGQKQRLSAAVAAAIVPGVAAAGGTLLRLVEGDWRPGVAWVAALAAATAAEALPVPIEGVGAGTTSFATVFIAATAAQLGPEASASLAGLAIL